MNTSFTTGPWSVVGNEHAHTIVSKDFLIADVFCPDRNCTSLATEEEAEANARLIAAAPDLVYALQNIRDRALDKTIELHPDNDAKGCVDDILEWAESAINLATGQ